MKGTISLGWRILLWFLLNLAIIGVAIALFLRAQFNIGFNTLLTRSTEARLEGLARPLVSELRKAPPEDWGRVLERTTAAWREKGVEISLFRNQGAWIAGDFQTLPEEVLEKLKEYDLRQRRARREPLAPPPEAGAAAPPPGRFEMFMLISNKPRLYWAGIHLDSRLPDQPLDATLLIASGSMRGGGLFLDYVRWLWLALGLIVISGLIWTPVVYRITQALGRLTQNAEMIAQGQFTPPPDLKRRDELGRLNLAHQYMANRLEGLISSQKRFLGDTAHELLSPLARLDASLSILESRVSEADRDYARRALKEVHHLSTLVQDLLTFSRTGVRKAVQLQPVPLKPLVDRVIDQESQDGQEVVQEVPETLTVRAEPELLALALANVLRNAIRYAGQAGPIEIHARQDNKDETVITVSDCGPGVPEESLPRLFDPFYRPETARTPGSGGTGLGLAIVKSCIDACQGRVTAANRQPRGFVVGIHLQTEP